MFTIDDLIAIMRSCAGTDEEVTLDGDILDVAFSDLGYDSLAVLEIQSQIQLQLDLDMADDAFKRMVSPRATIDLVNQLLSSGV